MTLIEEIKIQEEKDIVLCRRACREVARQLQFNLVDQTRITTATSELARNIFEYAGEGIVRIEKISKNMKQGLQITFMDEGPGIKDLNEAMGEGWSSHRGMGMGLPGARKLMDEFSITSTLGEGTRITVTKWRR